MKLAVISDIHGNLPALQTVTAHLDRWQPDQVIVNGDVVNRGPLSAACWQFVEERRQADGWLVLRGNHEEFVTAWQTRPTPAGDPEPGLYLDSYWVYQQLNGSIPQLTGLPNCHTIPSPDSQELRLTHASMRHNRDGILQQAPAAELRAQIAPAPSVFVTAHTHRPFIRTIDQTQVINVGSVGAPFDGDLRASYAQLTWQPGRWQANIIRLPYDREQTRRDFFQSGYLHHAGPLVQIFYHEWHTATPRIWLWSQRYEDAVRRGDLTLEESIQRFLAE